MMAKTLDEKLALLADRFDGMRWGHPEIAEFYEGMRHNNDATGDVYFNMDLPYEQRLEAVTKAYEGTRAMLAQMAAANPDARAPEVVSVPGCPEEPDTPAEVNIYRPKKTSKKVLPVLLCGAGGGLYMCSISGIFQQYADQYECLCVVPRYRTAFEGKWPGALNDLHAAYQYVVDNAAELGVDPDNVTLYGVSSGSHLVLSLAYRLKRYGVSLRGCVLNSALVDDRPIFASSGIKTLWDARLQWLASVQWRGPAAIPGEGGPEVFPNYATVEDCIGLCPVFLHIEAEDANASAVRAFADKLVQAGVYHELHVWGGSCHSAIGFAYAMGDSDHARRYIAMLDANITDCMKYDLRRSWIPELLGE